jgi:ribosome biogenesis protein SSF1/2
MHKASVRVLMRDIRRVMEPNTASRLRVRHRNVLRDFVSVAGPLHVSHFIVFSQTDLGTYMCARVCLRRSSVAC